MGDYGGRKEDKEIIEACMLSSVTGRSLLNWMVQGGALQLHESGGSAMQQGTFTYAVDESCSSVFIREVLLTIMRLRQRWRREVAKNEPFSMRSHALTPEEEDAY